MLIAGPPEPSLIGPVVAIRAPASGLTLISLLVSEGGGGRNPPPVSVEA